MTRQQLAIHNGVVEGKYIFTASSKVRKPPIGYVEVQWRLRPGRTYASSDLTWSAYDYFPAANASSEVNRRKSDPLFEYRIKP